MAETIYEWNFEGYSPEMEPGDVAAIEELELAVPSFVFPLTVSYINEEECEGNNGEINGVFKIVYDDDHLTFVDTLSLNPYGEVIGGPIRMSNPAFSRIVFSEAKLSR